jgi:hypothetical protein
MPMPMGGPPPLKKQTDGVPKPKSIKEIPSYIHKRVRGFLHRLFYIISLVWKTSPIIFISMCILCLANGLYRKLSRLLFPYCCTLQ